MVHRGRVKDGTIVLDEPMQLPEGAIVRVELATPEEAGEAIPSLAERLAPIIGRAKGLPEDAAENHDHYLYGTRKR